MVQIRRHIGLLISLAALGLLIGCSSGAPAEAPTATATSAAQGVATPTATTVSALPPTPTPTPVVAQVQATPTATPIPAPKKRTGGTVTIAQHWFTTTMDFGKSSSVATNVVGPITDYFLRSGPDAQIGDNRLGVLKSWVISDDGKTLTWTLKPGILWQDGVEMTSADIKWTWERDAMGVGSKSPAAGMLIGTTQNNLDHVEIVDKYTAKIYLKHRDVVIMEHWGNIEGDQEVIPAHWFEKNPVTQWDFLPLGSGPFKFVKFVPDQYVDYDANLNYWQPERIPGYDKLRIMLVPEPSTRVALLRSGQVDMASLVAGHANSLKADGYGLEGPVYGGWTAAFFRGSYLSTNWGNNLLFRQAVTMGIDRENIAKQIFPTEMAVPFAGAPPFAPPMLGYTGKLPVYPYDQQKAKDLLKQSGYNGDKCYFFGATTSSALQPEQNEVSEAIAAYMKQIGVNVEYKVMDSASRTKAQGSPKWPYWTPETAGANCIMETQVFYNRPSTVNNMIAIMITVPAGGSSCACYWDSVYMDDLYLKAANTVSEAERKVMFQALEKKLYDEYWTVPLVHRQLTFGMGPKVQRGTWAPTYGAYIDLALETVQLKP